MWMMAQVSSALKEDTLVILDSCCLSLLFFVIACVNLPGPLTAVLATGI